MLHAMSGGSEPVTLDGAAPGAEDTAGIVWFDLDRVTDAERGLVARATGLRVPERSEVAEIESSSRLVSAAGVLYLTTPMVSRSAAGELLMAPLGFVVTRDQLLTVRFAESVLVDHFAASWRREAANDGPAGMQPFLGLLEAMVDRLADVLEQIGAEMDTASAALFRNGATGGLSGRRRTAFLQNTLAEIGRMGARISQLRDSLLGLGRIVRFVQETRIDWLAADDRKRLATLDHDLASLNDYDIQITNRVQFLLDASLGFISMEQNDTIKVLTVVSIVGIPPTFVASLYGMNFHDMPELGWKYGYQYGLGVIALSIVVPLAVFWRKGWL